MNLNQLPQDLLPKESTPNFVFITPNLCNDGHDAPCKKGQPGGLISADAFLQKWIPLIQANTLFNHYSLLKSLENIFATHEYLGYAGASALVPFFSCVTSDIATKDPDQSAHCNLN